MTCETCAGDLVQLSCYRLVAQLLLAELPWQLPSADQITVQPDLNSFRVQALIVEYKGQGRAQELLLAGTLTPKAAHCSYKSPLWGQLPGAESRLDSMDALLIGRGREEGVSRRAHSSRPCG